MEKDENLQGMIQSTRCVYARQLKMTWDVKNWDGESSKTNRTKKLANVLCRNPTWMECEDETHTPETRTWESSGTPETSEFDCKGQNTSH